MKKAIVDLPLAIYGFFGLWLIDSPSWPRFGFALAAALALAFSGRIRLRSHEEEYECWRWSSATTKSILIFVFVCGCSVAPFLRPFRKSDWHADLGSTILLVDGFILSMVLALSVYLTELLTPITKNLERDPDVESLRLEHEACMTLFGALATAITVFFIGAFLTPILAQTSGGGLRPREMAWAFYCFAGGIIWLLRPCLARAKYLRVTMAQKTAAALASTTRREGDPGMER